MPPCWWGFGVDETEYVDARFGAVMHVLTIVRAIDKAVGVAAESITPIR